MATENVVASLDGLFKRVYADKVLNLIPENVKLLNMVSFVKADKLGDSFRQPVIVQQEQGYTYGGTGGTAFSLNEAIAGQVKDANIKGFESVMRAKISYGVASRSASSAAAFEQGTKLIIANMLRSFAKRLEISLLYGQKEIAIVASDSANKFVVTDASWAPGIWNALEGAQIDIYSANLGSLRGSRGITAVNLETKEVTYDGADLSGTVVATDRVLFKGAYASAAWQEMQGLHSIMSAYTDGSTDLFGINPQSYNVWRSSTYSAASADLSFQKIQAGIAAACGRGLDEDVVCMVSMKTWSKLCTDQAALRMTDSSYSRTTAENGSESIKFYGQNGSVEIIPSAFMKESLAMVFPKDSLMRIGSTDVTFKLPGAENDRFFRELDGAAGFELRSYADQSLFVSTPNKLLLINEIVNT